MRNEEVADAWLTGQRGAAGNLSTDGVSLWSYSLQIGETMLSGEKVVHDYTSGGSHGYRSQTTSCHVGIAFRALANTW